MHLKIIALLLISIITLSTHARWRDTISVVGSSTVFPFITVVAERFGKSSDFPTPKIESTGTGGGIKLFCSGVDIDTPDMTNASRRIKQSELSICKENGVENVIELLVGFDGIVVANATDAPSVSITTAELFLALASQVPSLEDPNVLVDNSYKKWSDVSESLPDTEITVYGPPPTSGTRDAFVELIMEEGCRSFKVFRDIAQQDSQQFKDVCHTLRDDGHYIETGENDNLIVRKLSSNKEAFGVFGFSFLDQNTDTLKGAEINGSEPTFAEISAGTYPISRPLYIYVKSAHVNRVPGMSEFLSELVSESAMGNQGYLAERGLIPLQPDIAATVRSTVINLQSLELEQ